MKLKRTLCMVTVGMLLVVCSTAGQDARTSSAKSSDQSGGMGTSAPTLGCFLRTSPMELRLIWGVPGATYVASPVSTTDSDADIAVASNATLSAVHNWLITDSGTVLTLSNCQPVQRVDLRLSASVDIGSSSSTGAVAAIYSLSAGALWVITGLPDIPVIADAYSGTDLPDSISAIAVSDESRVAAAARDGVYLLQRGAAPKLIYASTDVPSISFVNGSPNLAIADRAARQVIVVHDAAGTYSWQVIATANDNSNLPTLVRSFAPGTVVALAGSELLYADLARGSRFDIDVLPNADRIVPLSIPGVILVTASGRVARLVNLNEPNPHAYVMAVPADALPQ
jgi:hypothetical protein